MPEAAEVQVAATQLAEVAVGRLLARLTVTHPRTSRAQPPDELSVLEGRSITEVRRHGKWILVAFDERAPTLGIHLRMSGQLLVRPSESIASDRHVHAVFELEGTSQAIWFRDPRTFGELRVLPGDAPVATDLHDERLTARDLEAGAVRRRVGVKAVLLDQTGSVSGIGSYLADEALHRAAIAPTAPANELRLSAWERVLSSARAIAAASADAGGVTLADEGWVDLWGRPGRYGSELRVHARQHCATCGTPTRRATVGGRSARWCPRCQPARRRR